MDEMKTLQDFRAGAPVPDRARLEPGRRRLLDAATTRDPSWGDRVRWKIVAPAAAALVTAVVVLVAQTWPGAPPMEPPAASGVAFLETAARSVERTGAGKPAPRLGPDEWAYVITADLRLQEPGERAVAPIPKECAVEIPGLAPSVVQTQVSEYWRKGDGTKGAGAGHHPGKCGTMSVFDPQVGPPSPEHESTFAYYYEFAAEQHKPDRLVDEMHAAGIGPEWKNQGVAGDFRGLVNLFRMPLKTSPEFTATVFRAMALMPGVTVTQEYDKVFGRQVAVVAQKGGDQRAMLPPYELLLDPETYRVLGTRMTVGPGDVPRRARQVGRSVKPGDLVNYEALVDVGIVDKLGGRR